jgi:TatD DNase family protein
MEKRIFPYKDLFDSHSHLSFIDADPEVIISSAKNAGVMHIVDVANDLTSVKKILALKDRFPEMILATAGIHPEIAIPGSDLYISNINEDTVLKQLALLEEIIDTNINKISMIGETGLDYYWLEKSTLSIKEIENSKLLQKKLFEGQIKLAEKYNLPLTIHSRSSHLDAMAIIRDFKNITGIFHSFTGNIDEANEIINLDFSIGINGIITYKSAQTLRDTIINLTLGKKIKTPEDLYNSNIYLETDSPFLLPANVLEKLPFNSPQQISVLWDFVYNLLS